MKIGTAWIDADEVMAVHTGSEGNSIIILSAGPTLTIRGEPDEVATVLNRARGHHVE